MERIKINMEKSRKRNAERLQMEKEGRPNASSYSGSGSNKSNYKCSICHDTGWILTRQEHAQPLAHPCECTKRRQSKKQWKSCGLNPEMHEYTFTSIKVWNEASKNAKDTAVAYYTDFNNIRKKRINSIILCGQVGSGKTHLSIALSLNFIKTGINVVYMPYRDTVTSIKQNICDNEYYSKTISRFQKCDILLIDDLFKGKVSESDINIMFEIINYRYLNFMPVIVSSEFPIEKILDFDEGIGSRIYEMCRDYIVENKRDFKNNYRLR